MAAPRQPGPAVRYASLLLAAAAALPAFAAPLSVPATAEVHAGAIAYWFVTGAAMAVAAAMCVAWIALRDRIARRRAWVPYVTASIVLLVLGLVLMPPPSPWLLASAIGVLAWGLLLILWLARRMLDLLHERDRARAETKRVRQDSERDALTGVLNRGAWRRRLERMAEAAVEDGKPLSVLFFDIDLFKLVNDSLGHGVGDDCLRLVAITVGEELRGGDVLGRLGGEEFAIILPTAKRVHAIAVAERIRQAVQVHCRVVGEEVVELTVSIGVAEYLGSGEHLDALMERADRAMYNAKDSGRNIAVADVRVPEAA
jgi:diguanylate cyclase (GGDEF)-like protein